MKSALIAGCTVVFLSASLHAALNVGQIMPLGDSVTEGAYFASGTVGVGPVAEIPGGYRQVFYSDLTTAGDAFQFVGSQSVNPTPTLTAAGETQEEGHPGFTSTNLFGSSLAIYDNLSADFSGADSSPADVLLMIGTNDVNYAYSNNVKLSQSNVVKVPLGIFQLDPNVHLFWSLIPPSAAGTQLNDAVVAYNAWISAAVSTLQSAGFDLTLVDNYSSFIDADGSVDQAMYADSIHPNQAGYNAIGNTFAAAVESAVPEPLSAVMFLAGAVLSRRRRGVEPKNARRSLVGCGQTVIAHPLCEAEAH